MKNFSKKKHFHERCYQRLHEKGKETRGKELRATERDKESKHYETVRQTLTQTTYTPANNKSSQLAKTSNHSTATEVSEFFQLSGIKTFNEDIPRDQETTGREEGDWGGKC